MLICPTSSPATYTPSSKICILCLSRHLFSTKPCVSQASSHHGFKFYSCRSRPFRAMVPEMHKETEETDSNSPQTHGFATLSARKMKRSGKNIQTSRIYELETHRSVNTDSVTLDL